MSDLYFVRPTGAAADLKELEYLTALHQTEANHVRANATVSSLDIMYFLRSRFNMNLTHNQALEIIRGLGGDGHEAPPQKKETATDASSQPAPDKDNEEETSHEAPPENKETATDTSSQPVPDKDNNEEPSSQSIPDKDNEEPSSREDIRESLAQIKQSKAHLMEDQEDTDKDTDEKKMLPASEDFVEEYLDLVQILSTLLIPSFARLAKEGGTNVETTLRDGEIDDMALKDALRVFVKKSHGPTEAPPTPDIFADALASMLSDLPQNQHEVTEELVEYLLLKYGEVERAKDKGLIRAMTALAKTSSSSPTVLAADVLLRASTSDLGPWDTTSERRLSSFYFDIFGKEDPSKLGRWEDVEEEDVKDEETPTNPTKESSQVVDREGTNVDLVTDSHNSLVTVVLIWSFFFATVFIYGSELVASSRFGDDCGVLDEFWCEFMSSIVSWAIVAVVFSTFGILLVAPLSIGNNPFSTSASMKVFAASVAIFYSLFPYITISLENEDNDGDELFLTNVTVLNTTDRAPFNTTLSSSQDESEKSSNEELFGNFSEALRVICMSFGLSLAARYLVRALVGSLSSLQNGLKAAIPSEIFASHAVRGYTSMKRAANFKLTNLLVRAHLLHDPDASKYFEKRRDSVVPLTQDIIAMKNFILYGDQSEEAGGILWTWRRLLTRSLFEEEGIWISSRLVVIQIGQIIASGILVGVLTAQVPAFAEDAQRARDDLPPDLPDWVYDMAPKSWMIKVSLYPAVTCAGLVCLVLIVLYIPSTVATILKFRGQTKPSLGNPSFLSFRKAVDTTYMNLANAVYGLLAAAGLWYLVVFACVFIFVWPITQDGALYLIAWAMGLCVTIGIKMVLTKMCQSAQYRSFFRIKPRGARLAALALECWFIGLGGGVLITRLGQFLGGAFFWIGRTDVPFLADDISLAGVSLDMVPTFFVKDLLVHEAHRHPYMERLAQMYVMKARHRNSFVSQAGSAWRQLILLAFMPWMARYRVFGHERREQALKAFRKRNKLTVKEDDEDGDIATDDKEATSEAGLRAEF